MPRAKRWRLAAAAAVAFVLPFAAQTLQHETRAINVEIPVRVFKGDTFVDKLGLEDFELYEDGRRQKIEAFYLVKKTIIERREESREFSPRTARHFYLFFELGEYDARVNKALDHFVKNVLLPGDNLTIVTPMKTYRMKGELFGLVSRERTYAQVMGILRRDIQIGYSESRSIIAEMTELARTMASDLRARDTLAATTAETSVVTIGDPLSAVSAESIYQNSAFEVQLMHYGTLLSRLASLRVVDQQKLVAFAEQLKGVEGQKGVFIFYQRELLPKIDPRLVDMLATKYSQRPDVTQSLDTFFGLEKRDVTVNVDLVTRAYADSAASIHFLHIVRPADRPEGIRMEEQSEDVFGPFLEMARATGGYAASSNDIAKAMRAAVAASENYYLLYYTPADYEPDGRFHNVTIKVRGGGYRVSHRRGYVAD